MGRFHFVELLFVLLFFIQSTQFCFCKNSSFGCFERERQSLLNFKKSFIKDPSHGLSSWEGTGCCKWQGVSCSTSTGHVVKLDLRSIPFTDEDLVARKINPSLLELKFLNHLDLSGNDFQGSTIPKFFGLMKQLEYLNLSYSDFTGMFPRQLGNLTNLRVLDLHSSWVGFGSGQLSIEDLSWVSHLKSLQYLDMSYTDLSGARNLMQVLNMLPFLRKLRLSNCMLGNSQLPRTFVNSTFLSTIQLLDLSSNSFSEGPLPIFLQNMTSLRVLDLSSNSFNSLIPLWLCNLKNLVDLSLARNQFNIVEGGLSGMLWNHCHLKTLHLSSNILEKESLDTTQYSSGCTEYNLEELGSSNIGLTGHLPEWLGQFKRLKFLDLSSNSLNDSIPASIGNLSALRELDFSDNQLNGVIPASIGRLSNLIRLELSYNQLNGVIPALIGRLSYLIRLELSNNQLNGVIPESLGQLLNLEQLGLDSNSLEGALSEIHFSNLSKLIYFDISFNDLTFNVKPEWVPPFQLGGIFMSSCKFLTQLPPWLETQKKVEILNISNASISGPLPNWLWFMHIGIISLSQNCITTGPLPRNIGDTMPTLGYLSLANNLINGSIPTSFCKINSLFSLDLSNNMVSGDIPNCWSASNRLTDLKLSSNKLTGVIPNSIGLLSKLEWLHLKNNRLEGEVPSSLRNCTSLKLLNLGENRFSGNIPTWNGESLSSLQILRLQKNMFNGYIPLQLCQLTTLKVLDLAINNLSGTIPQCFGNFSGMVLQQTTGQYTVDYFEKEWDEVIVNGHINNDTRISHEITELVLQVSMDLSDNNLIGKIPEGLTILSGLHGLNLSHNHLTGNIPKNVGNLISLETLDFSANNLSGNIPTSISVLTSLRILNLSYNNFSGPIPTGRQLQTLVDPSIYAGNLELCGAPLLKRCPGDELSQAPIPNRDEENDEDDKSEDVWFYTIPVLGYITGFWGVLGVLLFKKSWRYAYFQLANNVIDWIYVEVAIKSAWLKKKMANNHGAD